MMVHARGPLQRLADRPVEAIAEFASGFRPEEDADVSRLKSENAALARELEEARRLLAEARALADTDPLVPILNRRAFVHELGRAIARVGRYGEEASLLYMDLDGLKQINDGFGHIAGDAALAHVGREIVRSIRKSDVAGRLGGDEFAIIILRGGLEDAEATARRVLAAVAERPVVWRDESVPVTLSFGASMLRGDLRPEEALDRADAAMYEHKRRRRD